MAWLPQVCGQGDHPALYLDSRVFERALEAVPALEDGPTRTVTGIVVPHHLVAADLMVLGFRAAAGREIRRILLLTPDHFKRSPAPVATTRRGFETIWGRVETDSAAVESLLAGDIAISESSLFDKEHGVHTLTPFIARLFPEALIVPVALRVDSKPEDWEPLIEALPAVVDEFTLIVQSTDFSHYLDARRARRCDQETLAVLAAGDPAGVLKLRQPAHLDSRAAQYVHLMLQRRLGNSGHVVLANRNSQDYSPLHQNRTTSYVVQVFEEEPGPGWPLRKGEEVWYFAGDTFFGRRVFPALSRPERATEVIGRVREITRGAPLVVNLEGVMVPRVERPKAQRPLAMDEAFALKHLKDLGVRAVSLANNHALDLGRSARDHASSLLKEQGIEPLHHGEWLDLGRFRMTGLTDICNESAPRFNRLREEEVSAVMAAAGNDKPAFVFVHWGEEWQPRMTPRQEAVLRWLCAPAGGGVMTGEQGEMTVQPRPSGLALVLGSHPHVASRGLEVHGPERVLAAPSLGNLIFDQPRGDGALVEVRFFPGGTHAVRWIPLGNVLSGNRGRAAHSNSSSTKPFSQENPAGTR
ncbi:MAG TPA: AmmeMemoRadiSam system protein B [Verrucomicrobiales bacterium]|nr:AmmeMemoRadiSam system protein B [Verrucomicrobiales bacterium]